MIDVKQAVEIAKEQAAQMLGKTTANLEEIERDTYKGREVWSITLSFSDDRDLSPIEKISRGPWGRPDAIYKKFLIDVEDGSFAAMKIRELISA